MAYERHLPGNSEAVIAASLIGPRDVVKYAGTISLHALPAATCADRPAGVNSGATVGASGLNQAERITVYLPGDVVRAKAGASFAAGVEVMVGPNGLMPAISASLFSASGHWVVGESRTSPQAAGEIFALFVNPRKA